MLSAAMRRVRVATRTTAAQHRGLRTVARRGGGASAQLRSPPPPPPPARIATATSATATARAEAKPKIVTLKDLLVGVDTSKIAARLPLQSPRPAMFLDKIPLPPRTQLARAVRVTDPGELSDRDEDDVLAKVTPEDNPDQDLEQELEAYNKLMVERFSDPETTSAFDWLQLRGLDTFVPGMERILHIPIGRMNAKQLALAKITIADLKLVGMSSSKQREIFFTELEKVRGKAEHDRAKQKGTTLARLRTGDILLQRKQHEAALEEFRGALELAIKMGGDRSAMAAAAYTGIGKALINSGNKEVLGEAIHYLRRNMDIRLELFEKAHAPQVDVPLHKRQPPPHDFIIKYVEAKNLIGFGYVERLDIDSAARHISEGISKGTKILGEHHSVILDSRKFLGDAYTAVRLFKPALAAYNDLMTTLLEVEPRPTKLLINVHYTAATAKVELAQFDDAIESINSAIAIIEETIPGPEDVEPLLKLSFLYNDLGKVCLLGDRVLQARVAFERSMLLTKAIIGPAHPKTAEAYVYIAKAMLASKKPEDIKDATATLEHALEILLRTLGHTHEHTIATRHAIRTIGLGDRGIPVAIMTLSKAFSDKPSLDEYNQADEDDDEDDSDDEEVYDDEDFSDYFDEAEEGDDDDDDDEDEDEDDDEGKGKASVQEEAVHATR